MIYEVYTTHIHYQETQIKKWMFYKQFYRQLLKYKLIIVSCNLKNN